MVGRGLGPGSRAPGGGSARGRCRMYIRRGLATLPHAAFPLPGTCSPAARGRGKTVTGGRLPDIGNRAGPGLAVCGSLRVIRGRARPAACPPSVECGTGVCYGVPGPGSPVHPAYPEAIRPADAFPQLEVHRLGIPPGHRNAVAVAGVPRVDVVPRPAPVLYKPRGIARGLPEPVGACSDRGVRRRRPAARPPSFPAIRRPPLSVRLPLLLRLPGARPPCTGSPGRCRGMNVPCQFTRKRYSGVKRAVLLLPSANGRYRIVPLRQARRLLEYTCVDTLPAKL